MDVAVDAGSGCQPSDLFDPCQQNPSTMPGPLTHIYTARRVADFLTTSDVTTHFIRPHDPGLLDNQLLSPALLDQLGRAECADAMNTWPKFTAVGAVGPDLFFFLQDYNNIAIPCDEIMLAMSLLYYLDDQGRLDDPYAGLVAILGEVNDTWASILSFIIKLDTIWKDFLKVWDATIGPIVDKAGQVIDDLTGGLLSELGDAISEFSNALMDLAEKELVTEGDIFNWFSLKMRKGYDEQSFLWSDMMHYRRTSAVPGRLIVHAREMLHSTDPLTKEHGEQLLAFALGWVTHVGTDVVEHSFVNEQCGGPFRTHWQRHHLIENHIDAWNYQCSGNGILPTDDFVGYKDTYPSLADSALYFAVQIPQGIDGLPEAEKQGALRQPLPDAVDQASRDARTALLDTDGELPLWLAEAIARVFVEVYADPKTEGGNEAVQAAFGEGPVPHPRNLMGQPFQDGLHVADSLIGKWLGIFGVDNVGIALEDLRKIIAPDAPTTIGNGTIPQGFPFPWEIMTAYRFMLSWFKRQFVATADMDRPEPPTWFTPPASDFDFGPPDFGGVSSSDDPASEACGAVLALLDWVFKSLEKAAQLLYDLAKSAASGATLLPREAIYEGVTLPLWQAAENIRMILVHLAYMMPQSQQFYPDGNLKRPNEIDEELIKLGHTVDGAFQQALAAAWDILGNLDKDPALTNTGVRDVLGAKNPWLPVRVMKGQKPPGILALGDDVVEYLRPWGFPDRINDNNPRQNGNYLETPLTVAGPYPTDTMPHDLLYSASPVSNQARVLYELSQCPEATDQYSNAFVLHQGNGSLGEANYGGTNPLGDPVIFSTYLIGQIANNPKFLSNFNLDADRGYGYLCWDWTRTNPVPGDTSHQDGMLHGYPPPAVDPEGADNWKRPDPAPLGPNLYEAPVYSTLQLHYPGRHCKDAHKAGGLK